MSDERTNVIISPLPGLIVRILVKKGDIIKSGQGGLNKCHENRNRSESRK